jgi:hypothetical protein
MTWLLGDVTWERALETVRNEKELHYPWPNPAKARAFVGLM